MSLSRRRFLTVTGVGALGVAGCRAPAPISGLPPVAPTVSAPPAAPVVALPPAPAAAPAPAATGISAATIAEAEKLLALELTIPERVTVAQTIQEQVELARALRKADLPNGLAPATVFSPGAPPRAAGKPTAAAARGRVRPARLAASSLPKRDEDIAYAPLGELAGWLRTRKLSSVRLTEICLERLERLGPKLECVVTLTAELALAQARTADAELARGKWRGPLHGIPYGAKDFFDTRGIRTTWGAKPFAERVPKDDAAVVRRLADAGAVLVAKLSLGELAYGEIWFGGKTRNPWNLEEGSSGSSAGSAAAVAAGLVPFALGTETYGSICSPAHRCGVTGLRPTFGRVPRTGAMALCWSLDKVGPMTRTVDDALVVLDVLHGADPGDVASVTAPLAYDGGAKRPSGLKVGYDPAWFARGQEGVSDVDRAVLDAARDLGLSLVEIELPDLPYDSLLTILFAEAAAAFDELTRSGRDDELTSQIDQAWPNTFRRARFLSAVDLINAERVRRQTMDAMAGLFGRVDLLLSPALAEPLSLISNMTGHPSLTLPAGFVMSPSRGFHLETPRPPDPAAPRAMVPSGVTLTGRLFDEATLGHVGRALENALGVWNRRPALG